MKTQTPEQFLNSALLLVESASIKNWASSDHNRPIFVKIAASFMAQKSDVEKLTVYIVANAIGLW